MGGGVRGGEGGDDCVTSSILLDKNFILCCLFAGCVVCVCVEDWRDFLNSLFVCWAVLFCCSSLCPNHGVGRRLFSPCLHHLAAFSCASRIASPHTRCWGHTRCWVLFSLSGCLTWTLFWISRVNQRTLRCAQVGFRLTFELYALTFLYCGLVCGLGSSFAASLLCFLRSGFCLLGLVSSVFEKRNHAVSRQHAVSNMATSLRRR